MQQENALQEGSVPKSEVDAVMAEMESLRQEMTDSMEALDKEYVATHKGLGKRASDKRVRGFQKGSLDGSWVMQLFGGAADGSTMLHEFVHVLQGLKDPRTGMTMRSRGGPQQKDGQVDQVPPRS